MTARLKHHGRKGSEGWHLLCARAPRPKPSMTGQLPLLAAISCALFASGSLAPLAAEQQHAGTETEDSAETLSLTQPWSLYGAATISPHACEIARVNDNKSAAAKLGRVRPNIGRCWAGLSRRPPGLGRTRPVSIESGPKLVELGSTRTDCNPDFVDIDPKLAVLDPSATRIAAAPLANPPFGANISSDFRPTPELMRKCM